MRRAAPRPIGIALDALSSGLAPASPLGRIQEVWERATGPAIAAVAKPVAERSGVLTVACESAVWAQELDLMGDQLVERLNAALGESLVASLRCRTA